MLKHYSHETAGTLLGGGTYGHVYSVQSGGKLFALKKFDHEAHATFVHESEMAIKTKGFRGVVQVKKSFIADGHEQLLMELCVSDLFTYVVEKEVRLSEEEALSIFYSICEAAAELHDRGIAHLDLKLENILLSQEGEWKLCDFGSASHFIKGERRLAHCKIGTPGYAAPEITGKSWFLPEKADSWSLGIILHALLLNCFPFLESSPTDSFSLNFVVFSQLSAGTKKLLFNLLALDPDVRPSATDVLLKWKHLGTKGKKETSAKISKFKSFCRFLGNTQ